MTHQIRSQTPRQTEGDELSVHVHFMKLALREARKGMGRTSPNPCVGAVVVKNGRIISKGYHRRAGTPHAEVNALEQAGRAAIGATIYVTLEPCNHTGRTPPCTEKIISAGIRQVVVGMKDPNPLVNGGGNDYLASRGVDVVSGIIEEDCRQLNRSFIKHTCTGLPWVTMKAGLSMDGRIATGTGHSRWVTSAESREQVHRIRDRVDAILVGVETAIADDPSLTTRLPSGRGKDPVRVILDSKLRLPVSSKMLNMDSSAPTWVFCAEGADLHRKTALESAGAIVKTVPNYPDSGLDLLAILKELGSCGIISLLVEGGGQVHASFIRQGLYDQANLFIAPFFIGGDGTPVVGELALNEVGQARRFQLSKTRRFGDDVMIEGFFQEKL